MEQNMKNQNMVNQHSLNDLGKKQLSIVDSAANILKKTNEEVNNNSNT